MVGGAEGAEGYFSEYKGIFNRKKTLLLSPINGFPRHPRQFLAENETALFEKIGEKIDKTKEKNLSLLTPDFSVQTGLLNLSGMTVKPIGSGFATRCPD
ncbi:MAG: hypothetical protein ACP5D7_22295 [Limnospira sp.]